eukprot:139350-Pelagomonas_calceolata.AAC.1
MEGLGGCGLRSHEYIGNCQLQVDVDYDEVTETEESKQEFIAGMKRGLAQNLCARNQNRLKGKGQQCQDSIEVGELARGSVIVPFDILLDDNLSDEEAQQFTVRATRSTLRVHVWVGGVIEAHQFTARTTSPSRQYLNNWLCLLRHFSEAPMANTSVACMANTSAACIWQMTSAACIWQAPSKECLIIDLSFVAGARSWSSKNHHARLQALHSVPNELQSTPPEELFDGSGYEGQVQQSLISPLEHLPASAEQQDRSGLHHSTYRGGSGMHQPLPLLEGVSAPAELQGGGHGPQNKMERGKRLCKEKCCKTCCMQSTM